jgi:hypothetical protein
VEGFDFYLANTGFDSDASFQVFGIQNISAIEPKLRYGIDILTGGLNNFG